MASSEKKEQGVVTMQIEMSDVSFGYSPGNDILHGVDLNIEGPGLVCIVGPNGVGKSTLVKMLCKILRPTSGTIKVDGRDISKLSVKDLSKIVGYVPSFTQDFFSMTVVDSILIGRHNHQKWRTSDEDIKKAYKAMRLLGVEQFAMRSFNELSAGQHQKVAIARGIVEETPILILDEPTSNLDVRHQVFVIEMLRALAVEDGKLVIMISHDLNLAAKYSHKIILMSDPGVIRKVGTPEEVITEQAVREVYKVECEVVQSRGHPLVVLGSALERS